jgi:hypothetical protein
LSLDPCFCIIHTRLIRILLVVLVSINFVLQQWKKKGVTTTLTQTALAYSQKKKDNGKEGNDNGNTVTIEECKNRGSASGFDTALDQECENLICTHPGNNASCVSENEGATTTTSPVTTPTGTLIVEKVEVCRIGIPCPSPSDFTIKVTGNNPTPSTFHVNVALQPPSTVVTLGLGAYKVSEEPFQGFEPSFSGDCNANGEGTIAAGDHQTCTITNRQPL